MHELAAGEVVKVGILANLWYEIKHDGWTVTVACHSGSIRVIPNPDGSVSISCVTTAESLPNG